MNCDGTGRTRLTNSLPNASDPAWSPGGKKIAYVGFEHPHAHTDVSSDIYVMNSDGTGQTRLTDTTAREYYPIWSPNGEKIAFDSYIPPNSFICVINADGTDRRCPVKGVISSTGAWAKG